MKAAINAVSWPSNICRIEGDFPGGFFSSCDSLTGEIDFVGDESFAEGAVTVASPAAIDFIAAVSVCALASAYDSRNIDKAYRMTPDIDPT